MIDVWVVEDLEDMRSIYSDLINATDDMICTHQFGSFEETEDALKSKSVSVPNIILLDIGLPGINGIDGLSRIKNLYPQINVIIQTVFEDNDKIFQAICAGASGYLLKRSLGDKILGSIREVCDGGAAMNSQIAKKVLKMFNVYVNPQSDYNLTTREKEILTMLVNGATSKTISVELNLSFFTVGTHVKNIYSKLQVNSRGGAVAKAIKENLI